jgi:hypothetical protein
MLAAVRGEKPLVLVCRNEKVRLNHLSSCVETRESGKKGQRRTLEVAVDDALLVKVRQTLEDLLDDTSNKSFRKRSERLEGVLKGARLGVS